MASAETASIMLDELSNVFIRIRCFKGTFSIWIKDDSKPYQVLPRHNAYSLKEPCQKELENPQEH